MADRAALDKWVQTVRVSGSAPARALLKAIDDPKVFVFGELLALANVQAVRSVAPAHFLAVPVFPLRAAEIAPLLCVDCCV